ncbi:MAG: hypothetical protein HC800_01890 [Phormidesmis sp. RL_2_1]|nr:hypothetical protein [Phormidesmis sp. RL_2_1]
MKKTDMELQAIREKLQLLQAEPPAAEILAAPWSASTTQHQPAHSRQAQAIEALKQRSSASNAVNAQIDTLIAQEIYKLEVQAHHINERSRQQADDLAAMQRMAQQAAVTLERQGVRKHPKLSTIAQLFADCDTVAIPHIDKDDQGNFTLNYDTVAFHHAAQDARETAASLRQRTPDPRLFRHPITPGNSLMTDNFVVNEKAHSQNDWPQNIWTQNIWAQLSDRIQKLLWQSRHHRDQNHRDQNHRDQNHRDHHNQPSRETAFASSIARPNAADTERADLEMEETEWEGIELTERDDAEHNGIVEGFIGQEGVIGRPLADYPAISQLPWLYRSLHSALWFSSGAIISIVIESAAISHPLFKNFLLVSLSSMVVFALYQVVFSKSDNYSLVYRLFIGMLGLLLASFLV